MYIYIFEIEKNVSLNTYCIYNKSSEMTTYFCLFCDTPLSDRCSDITDIDICIYC